VLSIRFLFPPKIDNQFRGHKVALWFFYLVTAVTLWRSQHHLFAPDGGAQSIATIPLDTFSAGASSTIVGVFALWGLSQLIIGIIYLIASIRYRAMIPLLYLLGIIEYAVRALFIAGYKPIETVGAAPGAVANVPFIVVFSIMLVLSLWNQRPIEREQENVQ
jgi:hypothetical protein